MLTVSDPTAGRPRLRLRGTIIDTADTETNYPLELNPVSLNVLVEEMNETFKVKMKNISKDTYKAKLVSYNPEFMEVSVDQRDIRPGDIRDIEVTLVNPQKHGPAGFERSFTIELSDPDKTRFTVPFKLSKHQTKRVSAQGNNRPRITASQSVRNSGLTTKTGNNISIIDAGTKSSSSKSD